MAHFPLFALALVVGAGAGGGAMAQGWGEPHLNVVPRTAEEAARIEAVTAWTDDFSQPEQFEALPAGAATVRPRANADAFSQHSPNLDNAGVLDFNLGDGLFRKIWVSAPSSTLASDGLGPFYNSRACQSCHLKDGRGHPPAAGEVAESMFLRLSIPGTVDEHMAEIEGYFATLPDPVYGGQLQNFASVGLQAEGRMQISYQERQVPLAGGEVAHLRAPTYALADPAYGPPSPDLMLSPRIAPSMIGLGLLEAVPEADILALADETDADGDGISGKPNVVWSEEFGQPMLGRFGLKAGVATIRAQSASAFNGDIGIASPMAPDPWGDCTEAQADCRAAPDGRDEGQGGYEINEEGLDLVTFYSRNLAVPGRRGEGDPQVLAGKQIFYDVGCASCHNPKFVTARLQDRPAQSFQLIWPYTDMLLHDMGEGLADHRPEARATGTEWRTAPLWGLGLVQQVNPQARYLHDGRARTPLEAVLWHGGEAQPARDAVVSLSADDRAALVAFLESL